MSITLFGTCRINLIRNNDNLNNAVNYTHCTKEVIQQIQFLLGEKEFPPPFDICCFRTGIVNKSPIAYSKDFRTKFTESNLCVLEICSSKKYICNNNHEYYLHHLAVDTRPAGHYYNGTPQSVFDQYQCVQQSDEEIENDILEIRTLLEPRELVVVSHYNAKLNGEYLASRKKLIVLLIQICTKHNIRLIQPSEVLQEHEQSDVITDDLGHYTELGISKFTDFMNLYLEDLQKKSEKILCSVR